MAFVNNQACLGEDKAETVISAGKHEFPQGIIVKKGEALIVNPGAHLKMGKNTRIIVEGKIIAKGTKDRPIIFSGSDGYWRGIKITGTNSPPDINRYKELFERNEFERSDFISSLRRGNIFLYCEFENLATESRQRDKYNRETGVIEVKNSSLIVSHSKFNKDILHIGCILSDESVALISNNHVSSLMIMKAVFARESVIIVHHNSIAPKRYEYQTWPDGIVSDNGMAIIYGNNFDGTGDDAIDCGNSLCFIANNNINRPFDDGIDIDCGAKAYIVGNNISQPYDEGIIISDQSFALLIDNQINGVKSTNVTSGPLINTANAALTLRSGGKAYCKNLTITDSDRGIYLKQELPLVLNQQEFNSIKQAILDLSEQEISLTAGYSSKQELLKILDNSYEDYRGLKILGDPQEGKDKGFIYLIRPLKKIFKLIGHNHIQSKIDLDQLLKIPDEKIKQKLARYINFLYLDNSIISNSAIPLIREKPYYLKIQGVKIGQDNIDLEDDRTHQLSANELTNFIQTTKAIDGEFGKINKKIGYVEKLIKKMDTHDPQAH
ncbi:MAG: right-handed parallel beta-helix repeat-containing protein [Candidatus Omnitrophota bacterium]